MDIFEIIDNADNHKKIAEFYCEKEGGNIEDVAEKIGILHDLHKKELNSDKLKYQREESKKQLEYT